MSSVISANRIGSDIVITLSTGDILTFGLSGEPDVAAAIARSIREALRLGDLNEMRQRPPAIATIPTAAGVTIIDQAAINAASIAAAAAPFVPGGLAGGRP